MATLFFRVQSDYEEVVKLRNEIDNLEKSIKKVNIVLKPDVAKQLEEQLAKTTQRFNELCTSASKAGAEIDSSLKKAEKEAAVSTDNLTDSMKKLGMVMLGGMGLKAFVGQVVNVRGQFQQMEQSMRTMLGSKEKADALMKEVREYAKISPLDLKSTVSATQMMVGFNIEASKVPTFLKAIGDVSQGNAQRFNSLTLAFSQMSAAGKLMGQDLNQMINAGFNPLGEMSRTTGKSIAKLKEEMQKGAISAEMVQQAFISATSEGGKFYKMAEEGAKTIKGQMSMLQDSMDNAFNEVGQKSEGMIISGIQGITKLIENYDKVGIAISGLIGAYGLLKAAELTNIALQEGMAVAMGKSTVATKLATVAMEAYNLVCKAHPLVALASAVMAVGAAWYAFADKANAAEVEQKRVNDRTNEQNKLIQDQKNEIDSLIGKLKDETATQEQKTLAFDTLIKKYPNIFSKYKTEKDLLDNLTQARKDENAEIEKKMHLLNEENVLEDSNAVDELNELKALKNKGSSRTTAENNRYDRLYYKYGIGNRGTFQTEESYINDLLKAAQESKNNSLKILAEQEKNTWNASLSGMSKSHAQYQLQQLQNGLNIINNKNNNISSLNFFGEKTAIDATEIQRRMDMLSSVVINAEYKSAEEYQKEAKKAWLDAEKEVDKIKNGKITYKSEAEYQKALTDAETKRDAAKSKAKKLGVDVTDSTNAINASNERIKELEEKQALERARQQKDLQYQVEQTRIDAMNDGFEKTLAQRKLNNDKEINSLERQREDYVRTYIQQQKEMFDAQEELKAKNNKNYHKQTFDASGISVDTSLFDMMISSTKEKQFRETIEESKSAWNEYLANYGTYLQKREAIRKQYEEKINNATTEGARASLNKQMDEALKDLDFSEFKKNIDWDYIFGDIKNIPVDLLDDVNEKLKKFKDTAKDLRPDDLKVLVEAMEGIETRINTTGSFGSYVSARTNRNTAQANYNNSRRKWEQLSNSPYADTSEGKEATQKAYNQMMADAKKLKNAKKTEKEAWESTKGTVENYAAALKSVGETIGGTAGELLQLGASAVTAGLGMADGIKAFNEAEGALEKSMAVLAVIQAAMQAIQIITSLFGAEDKTLKNYVEAMDTYLSLLSDDIKNLHDAMNDVKNTMAETIDLYKEYLALQKQNAQAIKMQSMTWLVSGGSIFSDTEGNNILDDIVDGVDSSSKEVADYYKRVLEKLQKYYTQVTGEKFNDWNTYSKFYRSDLDWIWRLSDDKIKELVKDTEFLSALGSDLSSALLNYANAIEDIASSEEDLFASLLDSDFDTFYSNFKDMVSDMEVDSENFADDFGEQLRRVLIKDMVGNKFKEGLKKLYEQAGTYANEGTLDQNIDILKEAYQNLADQAREEVETINNITGMTDSFRQEASAKGFQAMGQDLGEELNGRFTAVQMNTESIKNIADEIRDIQVNSYLELQQIRENTGAIIKPIIEMRDGIKAIEKNTQ